MNPTSLSLTSDAFIWTLRVLLVLAVIWAVWRWPKAAANTVWSILRRLLTLVVVSLLAVLNLAAPVNAQYGWYQTPADFFPEPGVASKDGASAKDAVAAKVTSSPLITGKRTRPEQQLSLTPTSYGGYQDFTVKGKRSGFTSTVTVWFPPSYTDPAAKDRTYPVIEGFHGIAPAPYAFFDVVHIDQLIQQQVAQGAMREAIVVIPHWAPNKVDNECVNTSEQGNVETWIDQDVPAWAYDTFRVQPGRESFSAFGMSAGGWCANMSAALQPSIFATAISGGGYWRPEFDKPFIPFGPSSSRWAKYDLEKKVAQNPPPIAAWSVMAKNDSLAYASTTKVAQTAKSPMSVTSTVLPSGGHRTDVWLPYLPQALAWLGQTSPGFAKQ